jgi:hypothetical protein
LQTALNALELEVEEGDAVYFVAKRRNGWSAYILVPSIAYTAIKED